MARFITRIQLQNATEHDYARLNDEMKKESFRLNSQYHLQRGKNDSPSLEYDCEGNISLSDIAESAFRAARKIGKTYSFTVIKYKNGREYNKKNNN
jgi:hypothetical protein